MASRHAGDKAVDLINNKQLLLNLNEPAKGDFSFVRPGKAFRSDLQGDRIKLLLTSPNP